MSAPLRARSLRVLAGAAPLTALLVVGGTPAPATAATSAMLYAYAHGTGTTAGCAKSSTVSHQCSLAEALSQATAGDTVALATSGDSGHYIGNWTVDTPGTSVAKPVTITSADTSEQDPVLDGNDGAQAGCGTAACNNAILTPGSKVNLSLSHIAMSNADNTSSYGGGAIDNGDNEGESGVVGATLTVDSVTFSHNTAQPDGGAINNAEGGSGTVVVRNSLFTHNFASSGGAIANSDDGSGSVTVTDSEFRANLSGAGGAIYNGGPYSSGQAGSLIVDQSVFSKNHATSGEGAGIDNGDGEKSVATVTNSDFLGNTADYNGGGIDNADNDGAGTLTVAESTFKNNAAGLYGGGIDNGGNDGYDGAFGALVVVGSTLAGDTAKHGPEIESDHSISDGDDARPAGHGTVAARRSAAKTVKTSVVVAGDLFVAPCVRSGGTWLDDGHNAGIDRSCQNNGAGDVISPLVARHLQVYDVNLAPTHSITLSGANPAIGLVPHRSTAPDAPSAFRALCPRTDQPGDVTEAGQRCNAGSVDQDAPIQPTLKPGGRTLLPKGARRTFSGVARPGSIVSVYAGHVRLVSTKAASDGTFTLRPRVRQSAVYDVRSDHWRSEPSIKIKVVRLTLTASGHHPTKAGVHRLSGNAPARSSLTLLDDGQSVDTTTAGPYGHYSFQRKLVAGHHYRVGCDGVRTHAIHVKP